MSKINPATGVKNTFVSNKAGLPASETNGGGIERPIDIVFGKLGEMYLVDFGYRKPPGSGEGYIPKTGVIWKVTKH